MNARLGRVHVRVKDLERGARFYTNVLGLRIVDRSDSSLELSSDGARRELTLHSADPSAPAVPAWFAGRFVGFEVPTKAELVQVCERLGGARASIVDLGDSWSVHTTDPDGNGVEIYCDTREDLAALGPARSARTLSLAELREAVIA